MLKNTMRPSSFCSRLLCFSIIACSSICEGSYTFEKGYYVFHPTTCFVCLSVCLCVCVSYLVRDLHTLYPYLSFLVQISFISLSLANKFEKKRKEKYSIKPIICSQYDRIIIATVSQKFLHITRATMR